jgi:hypothetical protein
MRNDKFFVMRKITEMAWRRIRCRSTPKSTLRTTFGLIENTPFGASRRGSDSKGSEGVRAAFRLRVYTVHQQLVSRCCSQGFHCIVVVEESTESVLQLVSDAHRYESQAAGPQQIQISQPDQHIGPVIQQQPSKFDFTDGSATKCPSVPCAGTTQTHQSS